MKLIVEVWCSPLRGEIYDHCYIAKSVVDDGYLGEELACYLSDSFFEDVFGEDHETVKGLWKVVFELETLYSQDYFGECDVNYYIEKDPYKSQCLSWSHVKQIWLGLNGKTEAYFSKPYRNDSMWLSFE